MRLALAAVLLAGCSASAVGPLPSEQEEAFSITWERVYGMERESRPDVTWMEPASCSKALPVDGAEVGSGLCVVSSSNSSGKVRLNWTGSISSSPWSVELSRYRNWLLVSSFKDDAALTETSNDELRDAGL